MVSGGRSLPWLGRVRSPGGAGRELSVGRGAGQVVGSFLTGDQSGDRAEHRVQVLASAEMMRQDPPVLQVAMAVCRSAASAMCGWRVSTDGKLRARR
jgi:hypothetical protein